MWPFTKETPLDLTPELLEFLDEQTPSHKSKSIFEISPQQQRVNQVLQKHTNDDYDYVFDRYKQTEKIPKVATINCAELQEKVLECFRGYNLTATHNQCKDEINKVSSCIEVQAKALKRLYYEDCVDVEQCSKIRYIVDKLFTENFGQYGENLHGEVNVEKFNKEIDGVFYKVWK